MSAGPPFDMPPAAAPADDVGRAALTDVLPSVAAAIGAPVPGLPSRIALPPARRAVVVLVDGLGDQLLRERSGHAPFLRHLLRTGGETLDVAFPSTTATSMGSFGTGLPPGVHGLVGLEVLDPARGVVFSELAWDPLVDPRTWQPHETVFEAVARTGTDVVHVGPGYFDGSGLTTAALRGARFLAADTLAQRVDAVLAAVRAAASILVYLYWGEVDKIGHVHGCESFEWGEQLSATDAELQRLAGRLPRDTLLVVTADHGMVDVPFEGRIDLATDADLAAGVRLLGGEPRAPQLYCLPGSVPDVVAAWRERLDGQFSILEREECIAAGWFGAVNPDVRARIGDVVVCATGNRAVIDSRTARPQILALLGLHGARTVQERQIPLLVTTTSRD